MQIDGSSNQVLRQPLSDLRNAIRSHQEGMREAARAEPTLPPMLVGVSDENTAVQPSSRTSGILLNALA